MNKSNGVQKPTSSKIISVLAVVLVILGAFTVQLLRVQADRRTSPVTADSSKKAESSPTGIGSPTGGAPANSGTTASPYGDRPEVRVIGQVWDGMCTVGEVKSAPDTPDGFIWTVPADYLNLWYRNSARHHWGGDEFIYSFATSTFIPHFRMNGTKAERVGQVLSESITVVDTNVDAYSKEAVGNVLIKRTKADGTVEYWNTRYKMILVVPRSDPSRAMVAEVGFEFQANRVKPEELNDTLKSFGVK